MKRILASLLSVCLICTFCVSMASASTTSAYKSVRASDYINQFTIDARTGTKSGDINFNFSIVAKRSMLKLGVSKIEIHKSDGSYVTTITGSLNNKLLAKNLDIYAGTYVYHGKPGVTYYAVVTFYASDNSGSGTSLIYTDAVTAK